MNIERHIKELRILQAHSVSEKEEFEITDRLKEAQHIKDLLNTSSRIFKGLKDVWYTP
jgi:hypothetical protein